MSNLIKKSGWSVKNQILEKFGWKNVKLLTVGIDELQQFMLKKGLGNLKLSINFTLFGDQKIDNDFKVLIEGLGYNIIGAFCDKGARLWHLLKRKINISCF